MKACISNAINSCVQNLLLDGRQEDKDLPVGAIEKDIKSETLLISDLVAAFKNEIIERLDIKYKKKWFCMKGVWGSLIIIGLFFAGFGYLTDVESNFIIVTADTLSALTIIIGSILAILGKFKAFQKIKK